MKIATILFLLILSGCYVDHDNRVRQQDKAIDACIKSGGIPTFDGFGQMISCKKIGEK